MSKLRFYFALWVGKLVAVAIGLVAKDRGTNLPGAFALKIDPLFIRHIKGVNSDKTVFITGTNGKSSTTKVLYHILTKSGHKVISNIGGANMTGGIAVPLLKSASLSGRVKCDFIIMETDERYVSRIREQLPAKYLAITNIQKDQVQRNGEPGFIRRKIREAIKPEMTVFINNDEPNSMSLINADCERIVRYAVGSHKKSFIKENDFFAVTMPCPVCNSSLTFEKHNMENIGSFSCSCCGFSNKKTPDYYTADVSFESNSFTLNGTTYAFCCNRSEFLYSNTLAISIALELGVSEKAISETLNCCGQMVGKWENVSLGDNNIKYFRIKQENSETLQSAISTIGSDKTPKTIIMGLDEYIDFYPPYINGCYMFDCSFKPIVESGAERCICTSPSLGYCGALRFLYEGFDPEALRMYPDSNKETLEKALADENSGNVYLIEEIPFHKRSG